jgi:uncharacterized protein (DUF302 family)
MSKTCRNMTIITFLSIAALLSLPGKAAMALDDPIVTTKANGDFNEILHNVRMAILGRSINIAHVLPASRMLHRTGPDLGYQRDVYADAETLEFCSARISHMLAKANPDNIVLCPFTISVYQLTTEPDEVRISYRVPAGRPGSEKAVAEVVKLIEGIIKDAMW